MAVQTVGLNIGNTVKEVRAFVDTQVDQTSNLSDKGMVTRSEFDAAFAELLSPKLQGRVDNLFNHMGVSVNQGSSEKALPNGVLASLLDRVDWNNNGQLSKKEFQDMLALVQENPVGEHRRATMGHIGQLFGGFKKP